MIWADYLTSYKNFLKLEKSLSANTIEAYMKDIQKFINFSKAPSPADVKPIEIRAFIDELDTDDGMSAPEGSQRGSEGCLSFPGISAQVTRARSVTVDWMGEDGRHYSARVHGLLARAVQHETDHLAGVVFVERVSGTQLLLLKGKLAKLRRASAAAAT